MRAGIWIISAFSMAMSQGVLASNQQNPVASGAPVAIPVPLPEPSSVPMPTSVPIPTSAVNADSAGETFLPVSDAHLDKMQQLIDKMRTTTDTKERAQLLQQYANDVYHQLLMTPGADHGSEFGAQGPHGTPPPGMMGPPGGWDRPHMMGPPGGWDNRPEMAQPGMDGPFGRPFYGPGGPGGPGGYGPPPGGYGHGGYGQGNAMSGGSGGGMSGGGSASSGAGGGGNAGHGWNRGPQYPMMQREQMGRSERMRRHHEQMQQYIEQTMKQRMADTQERLDRMQSALEQVVNERQEAPPVPAPGRFE